MSTTRMRRRLRSSAVVVAVALAAISAGSGAAAAPIADPGPRRPPPGTSFDRYGGDRSLSLRATGFFRTQRIGGRWWLVTPEGHPYYLSGMANADPNGTADRNGRYAYAETVAAKYGSVENWAEAQLTRFRDWGVNGLGGWGDTDPFAGRIPYTQVLSLASVRTDLWNPDWADGARRSIDAVAAERRNDPWFVGYFTENELSWALDIRSLQTSLDLYLALPATAPGKQEVLRFLRQRYRGSIDALRADFPALAATTWEQLEPPVEPVRLTDRPGGQATQGEWSGRVMSRYYAVVGPALRRADPNHLNLGVRFIAQLTSPQVLRAAARWVDVMSVNYYELTPQWAAIQSYAAGTYPLVSTADLLGDFSLHGLRPVVISEFGYRAADSGLPNSWPPMMPVLPTQRDRADHLANYGQCALNNRAVVGTVWFEFTDEPAAGRFDGEDSNWGVVGEDDEPYAEVTATLRSLHDAAYARLGRAAPLACTDIGPPRPNPSSGS